MRLHWKKLFALSFTVLIIAGLLIMSMPTDDNNWSFILSAISAAIIGCAVVVDLVQSYRQAPKHGENEAGNNQINRSRWSTADRIILVVGGLTAVSGIYKLWLLIAAGH
ncbi:hypothetical protein [Lacticaseibacillus jixiensis]|uniref:hypothetical protein n=1 Tax=Lacticaseibacillus jixiensis TaxID=3231926 RepID=UPI0036F2FD5E